jgi:hypothetical protein
MNRQTVKLQRKGYAYYVTRQQIADWIRVPAALKLRWLEAANRFLNKALTPEARRIRELFRQGRI